jgi:selenocysteine lyase/cysteine desulfurase
MPLGRMAALAARYGAEISVDAIQALGAVPLDAPALGLDYLATGAHKWLMGTHGAGFLYVKGERVPALRPALAGWLSHEDAVAFLTRGPGHLRHDRPIRRDARMFEAGSMSSTAHAALEASLDLIAAIGVAAIHAHVNRYLDRLEALAVERGFRSLRAPHPAGRSCILSLLPPPGRDVVRMHEALAREGVAAAIPDGALRFAPHWPNGEAELPAVATALDRSLAAA